LVGAPNAGKTSLLNSLLGKPIGAVSCKVNTTREAIVGVLTEENYQIELVDCPGIVPRDGSEDAKELSAEAWMNLNDCDVALLVVDTVKRPSENFLEIARKISPKRDIVSELTQHQSSALTLNEQGKEVILVLNKSDLVEDKKWLKIRNVQLSNQAQFESCFYVSAKERQNVDKLKQFLKQRCLPGPWRFSPDTTTTLSMTAQLEQLIRGVLFTWFHKDVPYKIEQQTVGWTDRLDGTLVIEHELIVKDSVVARMIIGTKARVLHKLRDHVVYKLQKLWGMEKIVLLLHVKAREQRESKKNKLERSKRENFNSFTSRGAGTSS
jgi:GTP-binding protein Era